MSAWEARKLRATVLKKDGFPTRRRRKHVEDRKFVCHTVHRRSDGASFKEVAVNCQRQIVDGRKGSIIEVDSQDKLQITHLQTCADTGDFVINSR